MTAETYCAAYQAVAKRMLAGDFIDVATFDRIVEADPATHRAFLDIRDENERGAVLSVEEIAARVHMPVSFVASVQRAYLTGGPAALIGSVDRNAN